VLLEIHTKTDIVSLVLDLPRIHNWRFLVDKVDLYDHKQADSAIAVQTSSYTRLLISTDWTRFTILLSGQSRR